MGRMRGLLVGIPILLFCTSAAADRLRLEFDGQITGIYGAGPSLDALGISLWMPVHYSVNVDTERDGWTAEEDGTKSPCEDEWTSPEEYSNCFYAALASAPYPTPGSYYGWNQTVFVGRDVVSPSFPDCDVLGRLFVGTSLFHIDGCAPVADWAAGLGVGSGHVWLDPTSGEAITVYTQMTVTSATPIAELPAVGFAGHLLLVAALLSFGRASLVNRRRPWDSRAEP